MAEIRLNPGMVYWWLKQFSIRGAIYNELVVAVLSSFDAILNRIYDIWINFGSKTLETSKDSSKHFKLARRCSQNRS